MGDILSWQFFFLSVLWLCHSAAFRPLLFLIRSHKLFKLLFHCKRWVIFPSCCFQDLFFAFDFQKFDHDVLRYRSLCVYPIYGSLNLLAVHINMFHQSQKVFGYYFFKFFFYFFPFPLLLGLTTVLMLVCLMSHMSLRLYLFFVIFISVLQIEWFLLTSFNVHWFFHLLNLLWVPLVKFSLQILNFSTPRFPFGSFFYNFFYFIEVLYQLINCHHVFLYILNIVFFSFWTHLY